MDNDLGIVARLERQWLKFPKNQVWHATHADGETQILLACQVGCVRLLLITVVGKRNGLKEEIYALDTSKQVALDKLLLAEVTAEGDGYLLPLIEMRMKVRQEKQDPRSVGYEYMGQQLQNLLADPNWWESRIKEMEREHVSVATVSGGAPGLGKRH